MLRVIDGSRDLIDADVSVTYCAAHAVPEYATHSRSLPSLFIDLVSPWGGGGGGETIMLPPPMAVQTKANQIYLRQISGMKHNEQSEYVDKTQKQYTKLHYNVPQK